MGMVGYLEVFLDKLPKAVEVFYLMTHPAHSFTICKNFPKLDEERD